MKEIIIDIIEKCNMREIGRGEEEKGEKVKEGKERKEKDKKNGEKEDWNGIEDDDEGDGKCVEERKIIDRIENEEWNRDNVGKKGKK